jgi:hypothetical protein
MAARDPEKNFETLWKTFNERYPFFALRNVDWKKQYDTYRPRVTASTSDDELFDIISAMLDPLNDGHVEVNARGGKGGRKRNFTAEKETRFGREFPGNQVDALFRTTAKTLKDNGFGRPEETRAWMLHYARSPDYGYIRILELEGIGKGKLNAALDEISRDFRDLSGFIIDIRNCPGGDDTTAIAIINRFTDKTRVAFHRKTKTGPGDDDFSTLQTWQIEPEGDRQFTGPIVLLTNDAVFSGGEAFALAIRNLPYVTIIGDHTNGIFSYTLEKDLPNGWEYCLSYQVYMSPDMVCYEGKGVPVDIELHNSRTDIANDADPLILRALEVLRSKAPPPSS